MGAVYRATDLTLARPVALKIMHRQFANQPEFQQRFMQEAQAAARLNHPSIVTVYNFDSKQGLLYIVMEYVPGMGMGAYIKQLIKREQVIKLSETLFLIAQAADALGYAHESGVVHRDVKPDNILIKRLTQPERPGEPPCALRSPILAWPSSLPAACTPPPAPSWARCPTCRPNNAWGGRWTAVPTSTRWE